MPNKLKRIVQTEDYAQLKSVQVNIGSISDIVVYEVSITSVASDISEYYLLVSLSTSIKVEDLLSKDIKINITCAKNKQTYRGYVDIVVDCNFFDASDIANKKQIKKIYAFDKIALLRRNTQSRVFALDDIENVIKEIFKPYKINISIKLRVSEKKIVCQYNEDDYTFFTRICSVYKIGFYLNHQKNEYIVHDSENTCNSLDLNKILYEANYKLNTSNKYKVEYCSRVKWATNSIKQSFSHSKNSCEYSYFFNSYSKESVLKTLSESYSKAHSYDTVKYYAIDYLIFAGYKINEHVVVEVYFNFKTQLKTNVVCITGGVKIVKFVEYRTCVFLNGYVQAKADKVQDNQNVMDTKLFELPIKLEIDQKHLIYARQLTPWIGKFYGHYFPIRENTEVLVLFHDSLMTYCSIINCYINDAHSLPYQQCDVGIKSATLESTSSTKYMNQLSFTDKKDHELMLLQGKKDMKLEADEKLDIVTNKIVNLMTENMSVKTDKKTDIQSEEQITLAAKEVEIDSKEKQKLKTEKDLILDAGALLGLKGKESKFEVNTSLKITGQNITIEGKQVTIKATKLQIEGKTVLIKGTKTDIESKILIMKSDMYQTKMKLCLLKAKLYKLESSLIMLDAKMILLKANLVNVV